MLQHSSDTAPFRRQNSNSSQDFYHRDAYMQITLNPYIPPRQHRRVFAIYLPRHYASEPRYVIYNGGVRCTE